MKVVLFVLRYVAELGFAPIFRVNKNVGFLLWQIRSAEESTCIAVSLIQNITVKIFLFTFMVFIGTIRTWPVTIDQVTFASHW